MDTVAYNNGFAVDSNGGYYTDDEDTSECETEAEMETHDAMMQSDDEPHSPDVTHVSISKSHQTANVRNAHLSLLLHVHAHAQAPSCIIVQHPMSINPFRPEHLV